MVLLCVQFHMRGTGSATKWSSILPGGTHGTAVCVTRGSVTGLGIHAWPSGGAHCAFAVTSLLHGTQGGREKKPRHRVSPILPRASRFSLVCRTCTRFWSLLTCQIQSCSDLFCAWDIVPPLGSYTFCGVPCCQCFLIPAPSLVVHRVSPAAHYWLGLLSLASLVFPFKQPWGQ